MRRRFMSNNKSFDYSQYMTIEALENGVTITMPRDVEYNVGNGWVVLEAGVASPTLAEGQLISFKSQLLSRVFGTISISGYCFLRGNCMSLIGKNTLHNRAFYALFYECPIVGVEETFLPATTLADFCYSYMFYGCTSLTTAPALPATTLAENCYMCMFINCTSLTDAPELPATTLASGCYGEMFYYCKNLNYIKMLATDISAGSCLYSWVGGVASSGTFVKNPEATWEVYGDSGIPNGWTVKFDGEESGGGKIENYLRKGNTSITKQVLTLDFPAETDLYVYYTTSMFGSDMSICPKGHSTHSLGLDPGDSIVSIDRIEPNEDDFYIYKIAY